MQAKACELCGKRAARYVCQNCGREVCEACLELHTWVCSDCYGRVKPGAPAFEAVPWLSPLRLFLLGFSFIFVGIVFVTIAMVLSGSPVSFGTVVFVGPIPIVLGGGTHSLWAILLAVATTILGVIFFLVFRKRA